MAERVPLFSLAERTTLSAVLDRLIPTDNYAGAVEAGGIEYIEQLFRRERASELALFREGLQAFDQLVTRENPNRAGAAFADLSPKAQDRWLARMERGELRAESPRLTSDFFEQLLNLAAEGFYADPAQRGNRGAVSWRMLGYDPRIPGRRTDDWTNGSAGETPSPQ